MDRVARRLKRFDEVFIDFIKPRSILFLRISIGLIYVLFGILKFFPQYSPAEQLASDTISMMTLGIISDSLALNLLAIVEVGIGFGLILGWRIKWIIWVTLWHMVCTFFPMLFIPDVAYSHSPISLSLVGQYILKNIIIIAALLTIYSFSQKSPD